MFIGLNFKCQPSVWQKQTLNNRIRLDWYNTEKLIDLQKNFYPSLFAKNISKSDT